MVKRTILARFTLFFLRNPYPELALERQQITQRRIFAMSLQATTPKISCGEAGTHVVAAPCPQF